ncbi:peroxiredoxin [Leucothrix mucor]|uniref:peroxiredoxin n=1 Tax=Leucothrix mucor TaxID=45248 RepID=UPI0003B2F4BB|nr:peroxiredoxin [Leucothrix mucor]
MISVGDTVPTANITVAGVVEQTSTTSTELFSGKKVVLFALPGAFTPTCSKAHLPGYVTLFDSFLEKGVDMVACLSVNDAFVMQAWAKDQNAENITMIADGGAAFTKSLGLEMDTGDFGGVRAQRFAMIIDNGVVSLLNIEPPKTFESSKAETILEAL